MIFLVVPLLLRTLRRTYTRFRLIITSPTRNNAVWSVEETFIRLEVIKIRIIAANQIFYYALNGILITIRNGKRWKDKAGGTSSYEGEGKPGYDRRLACKS